MSTIKNDEAFKSGGFLDKEVLSFREALVFLDLSASTLYKMTHKRIIPFFKPSNKRIYFKKQDLFNYMLRNRQSTIDEMGNDIDNYLNSSKNG